MRKIVNEVRYCTIVKTVVNSGDALCYMAAGKIRKRDIRIEDRYRLPERLDGVENVTMRQHRAFRLAGRARGVDHYRDIIQICGESDLFDLWQKFVASLTAQFEESVEGRNTTGRECVLRRSN